MVTLQPIPSNLANPVLCVSFGYDSGYKSINAVPSQYACSLQKRGYFFVFEKIISLTLELSSRWLYYAR